jgi:uncharacterized protein YecT (DUF1311 family)
MLGWGRLPKGDSEPIALGHLHWIPIACASAARDGLQSNWIFEQGALNVTMISYCLGRLRSRHLLLACSSVLILGAVGCDRTPKHSEEAKSPVATAVAESPKAVPTAAPARSASGESEASVEARYTPEYSACMSSGDAANGVTSGMASCGADEIAAQDAKLNSTYQLVMQKLEKPQRDDLRTAQRAWIKFRDTKCQSESNSGGTMDILNGQGCILDATIRRTIELEDMGAMWGQ